MRRARVEKPTGLAAALDRFAAVVSPKWYRQRVQERTAASLITALAPYRGAENSRLRADWVTGDGSADSDTLFDLPTLRERTRDLTRNDGMAAAMLGTLVRNTVGTGIRPQSRVDAEVIKLAPDRVREFQKAAENAFKRWCPQADARHELNFFGLQRLAARSFFENGDSFLIIRNLPLDAGDGRRRTFSTAVELVEADRVATPGDFARSINPETKNEVRGGIERNSDGQSVAYWILKQHPGDAMLGVPVLRSSRDAFMRVPKYDENGLRRVVHLMDPLRVGQSRGVSTFAPVLTDYKDLQDVMEAERVAQRIAACFGLILTQNDPFGAAADASSGSNSAGQLLEEIEPGMIHRAAPGETVTQVNPLRPGNNFDPFIMRCSRIAGAAQGVPYEATSMDYSQVNFASGRCARIDARVTFLIAQDVLSQAWQAVYDAVIEEAFTLGMLPDFTRFNFAENREFYTRALWIGPGYGYVQPDKEVQAARDAITGNLSTLAAENALLGNDWQEVLEQRAAEQAYMAELGLSMPEETAAKDEEDDSEDEPAKPKRPAARAVRA